MNEHYQVACEKSSYDLRSLGGNMCYVEECVSFRSLRIGYELQGARSQIKRALESARSVAGVYPESSLEGALEHIENAERHLFALQRESQSSGDDHCSDTTDSSSFEEELILATPVQGVQGDGRLILGDPKILSASALKI